MADGSGSFAYVHRTLKRLNDAGKRFGIRSTLTASSVDKLPEIAEKTAATREEVIAVIDSYAEPFNLNAAIPVRPTLYAVADGSVILHLAIHHIAFDGGSAKTFVQELIDGLNGKEVTAAAIDLSDLYDDSLNEKYESGMAFYRELFADGVPVNEMGTTIINVTVIHDIDANDRLKFLNTFLKPSLIFLANILQFLILIVSSFLIVFLNSTIF